LPLVIHYLFKNIVGQNYSDRTCRLVPAWKGCKRDGTKIGYWCDNGITKKNPPCNGRVLKAVR
jgi:hypothetical protein